MSKVIGKRFAAVPPHPRADLVEIVNLGRLEAKSRFLGPCGFGYVKNLPDRHPQEAGNVASGTCWAQRCGVSTPAVSAQMRRAASCTSIAVS